MNKAVAKIRIRAKQSLKILDMLEGGSTPNEIVQTLGVERSLVEYYKKIVNQKDELQ